MEVSGVLYLKLSRRRRPAVAQNADGSLEVFVVNANDNNLYHRWQTAPSSSSQWSDDRAPLGGPLAVDPVIAQNANRGLEVFMIRADYNLYHRWQTAPNTPNRSHWSDDWAPLGQPVAPRKRPAVAQNADGRLEVYIVGSDRQLYHIRQTSKSDSTQWSKPVPFTGGYWPLSSNPAVAQNADGRLEVFMVGSDGQLYHIRQAEPNDEWDGRQWAPLGGPWH